MNLVGNSCVSAFITRDCFRTEFNNPFCWAKIDFLGMYNLIRNWDAIKFDHVEFRKTGNFYTANIDGMADVQYIHYIEDATKKGTTFEKCNVLSPDILPYVKEKYFSRLEKMKEPPTFLLAAGYWQEYYVDDEQIERLIRLDSTYPIIVCMPNTPRNRLKTIGNVKIHNHSFTMGIDGIHRKMAYYIADYYWGLKGEEASRVLS